jgi:hypothetical protein
MTRKRITPKNCHEFHGEMAETELKKCPQCHAVLPKQEKPPNSTNMVDKKTSQKEDKK